MSPYLDYARRGENAWWRYLAAIVLALFAGIALEVAIVLAMLALHLAPQDFATELVKPTHPVVFFLGNGVAFAIVLATFAAAIRLLHGKSPADVIGEWRWGRFAAGLGLWTGCLVLLSLADFAIRPGGFRWSADAQTPALALSALVGLGVQTFTEEFVFRGYLTQGLLLAVKRPWPAAVLSGIVFGAMHIPNGVPQWANATLFGIVAALIAIRTGGIAFTFGLHLINNLFGAVIVVSAGDVFNGAPGLFTQSTPNLMWWDVGLGAAMLAVPAWLVLRRRSS
jgi:membrane protease YdiL (CAAX protease family)